MVPNHQPVTIINHSYKVVPPKRYKLVYKPHEYYRYITNKNHSYWSYKPTLLSRGHHLVHPHFCGLNLQKHAALYPVDFRAAHGGDRPKGARVPGLPHGRFLRAEEMLSFAI